MILPRFQDLNEPEFTQNRRAFFMLLYKTNKNSL